MEHSSYKEQVVSRQSKKHAANVFLTPIAVETQDQSEVRTSWN